MQPKLNCSTLESTVKSCAEILDMTEGALVYELSSQPRDLDFVSFKVLVDDKFNFSDLGFETIWFHGTRTNDLESFKVNGIQTTSEISPKLEKFLRNLSDGIPKTELSKAHSNFRHGIKKGLRDEGPYACLFKNQFVKRSSHYVKCPELVEEISKKLVGGNFQKLVAKFEENTEAFLISFKVDGAVGQLKRALFSLYLVSHNFSFDDTAEISDGAFFNANGKSIKSDSIYSIGKFCPENLGDQHDK